MATYLILNLIFILFICILFRIKPDKLTKHIFYTLTLLMILTAIFDNLIIASSIVSYDKFKILGVFIVKAPVEDFMYAILAGLLVPIVWNRIGERSAK